MNQPRTTDWDRYYRRPFLAATLTRSYTGQVLLGAARAHLPRVGGHGLVIAELGGANSCFYGLLTREIKPRAYHIIDPHQPGLNMLWRRRAPGVETVLHQVDILEDLPEIRADVVISVGLIEHLPPGDLDRAIAAHFRLAAPGGLVLITFPTPTWLYKAARLISEALGLWIFHDERPLTPEEVIPHAAARGLVVQTGLIWPIVFTQALVAIRVPEGGASPGVEGEASGKP